MENLGIEMDSQQLNDEQLCQLVSQGQREAEEILVIRYTRLVRSCARPFFLVGGDSEDLTQEGMVGLLRAIREFDGSREATFRTFAEVCIRNRLLSALRWASRDKHAPLNQSIPLDTPFFEDHSYKASTTQSHGNPEDLYIDQEGAKDLMTQVQKQLSELESKILGFYLDGLSYMEIAATVGKTPKSVDNAVQRIRRKVAQQLTQSDLSGN
ncbi:sigma-70 family RNA polymerase sigma factor [Bengtsoniella intestinalis]|uniref:sigma-70 family RNA polymerase sigma factor n=1 Tax=Bengtsoniella intestinalis TaxID=3073143 RepID=UPI00391F1D57